MNSPAFNFEISCRDLSVFALADGSIERINGKDARAIPVRSITMMQVKRIFFRISVLLYF